MKWNINTVEVGLYPHGVTVVGAIIIYTKSEGCLQKDSWGTGKRDRTISRGCCGLYYGGGRDRPGSHSNSEDTDTGVT